MQNKYVGDVGDYGKFGLLRWLFNAADYRLGINWYLHPDEDNNDGRHIEYLNDSTYKKCDVKLFELLKKLVHEDSNRTVEALEKSPLFEINVDYYSECVHFYEQYPGNTKLMKEKRLGARNQWKTDAINQLANCNALYLDPDNGLEVKSCRSTTMRKAAKYLFYDEVNEFHKDKEITIIYHHLNRHKDHGNHTQQIQDRLTSLKNMIEGADTVFGLRYRPMPSRAFFIIMRKSCGLDVKGKLSDFLESEWGNYFDSFYESSL